ncbi:hypothetical protein [Streptomyces californicus]|uniref:hypothetical protein n=1 Tax=Streptomyces californicus TaxID=67351 RepID=UPI0004BFE307|nr:hypothetical protein [Streptomyces californicus]
MTAPSAELGAGVAMLSAAHQVLNGTMTEAEFGEAVACLIEELWPGEESRAVWPVAYLGLRIAALFATETGTEVETVLGFLGTEVASLPNA